MPHVTWEFILKNELDKQKLSCKKTINEFAIKFCERFELTLLPQRLIYKFNGTTPDENGITAFYILSESGIHIQTWPEYKYGFVDVFSCKHFNHNDATSFLKEFFGDGIYKYDVKWRGLIISRKISCNVNSLKEISDKDIILDTKQLQKELRMKNDLKQKLNKKLI